MRAKEIFGLVVRLTGLWFLYEGLSGVPTVIQAIFPVFPHFYTRSNIIPSLLLVGWPLLLGYWFLRGAPPLIRLAYPTESNSRDCTVPRANPIEPGR